MNYNEYLKAVEDALIKYAPKPDGFNDTVVMAAQYSLMGGGKRLRPVILLSAADTFGSRGNGLYFAAAIEMIHTYSLIHDDLPAMDDDDYRRGRLSCHKKFGEWAAVLAGDALLNSGFETMLLALLECDKPSLMDSYLKAFNIIAQASGTKGMIGGQTADIEWENKEADEETLTNINLRKTGALIAAAFEGGAIIGGANETEAQTMSSAGKKIGLAFQIRDDMLDCEGTFLSLGKLTGSDQKNNKTTYASILGHEGCAEKVKLLSQEALCLLKSLNRETSFLEELTVGLIERKS